MEEKLLWNQQKLKLPGVQWKRLVPCVQTLHVVLVSIYTVQRRQPRCPISGALLTMFVIQTHLWNTKIW